MSAYADIQYLRNTELWKSYTPEWKDFKREETPEIEWKYWLKNPPWRDIPFFYVSYFCDSHTTGYWKFSSKWNFRVCNTCDKLPMACWPLFIFECDGCEEPFLIKRYPNRYDLCEDCNA